LPIAPSRFPPNRASAREIEFDEGLRELEERGLDPIELAPEGLAQRLSRTAGGAFDLLEQIVKALRGGECLVHFEAQ